MRDYIIMREVTPTISNKAIGFTAHNFLICFKILMMMTVFGDNGSILAFSKLREKLRYLNRSKKHYTTIKNSKENIKR